MLWRPHSRQAARNSRRSLGRVVLVVALVSTVGSPLLATGALADGPWSGAITLTANPSTVDANSTTSVLVGALSTPLTPSYAVSIYDGSGQNIFCAAGVGTQFSQQVQPANNTTGTYTAYVAQDCPQTGPPVVDVRATASASVTNVGWTGSFSSFTANPSMVDANGPASVLSGVLSQPLAGPYAVSIYDGSGQNIFCAAAVTHFAQQVQPANNTTGTYTAYVAQDCPQTGPPVVDVRATASASVTNVGWTGSFSSFTANPSMVDANGPASVLSGVLSQPLAGPYAVSIYDGSGQNIFCAAAVTHFAQQVQPANNTTGTYTAYVAQDCPQTGPPVVDVRASADASVSNLGYTGTLSLSAAKPVTASGLTTVNLTASLSTPLAGPYALSVYDDTGALLYCAAGIGSAANINVTLPGGTTKRTYTAYVAQDCPASGTPINDVRTFTGLSFVGVGKAAPKQMLDGVDLPALAVLAAKIDPAEIDAAMLLAPGTRLQGFSVTDQYEAYSAAIQAGKTAQQALVVALAVAGAGTTAVYMWDTLKPQAAPPKPIKPTTAPLPAPSLAPIGPKATPSYTDDLAARLMVRNKTLTYQQARTAAQQCVAIAQRAIAAKAIPALINNQFPCDALPIFLPGSDLPATTQHDFDAILGASGVPANPQWSRLNYVSSTDKVSSGTPRKWYASQPACQPQLGEPPGYQCDEYPFFASAQGGPGASLRRLDGGQNTTAGSRYGNFVVACALTSGGSVASTQTTLGSPFLVIPMAFTGAPPTLRICTT